ncbi:MAG: ABC transporter substrate-binding protein [Candidatus Levybacteria bacterium]|nr:ABC transporter substrate-binding protein [Candidatus Levybacteria bacterium]
MIVFRRRLIFWLVKAYLKKLGKRILLFFLFGLIFFIFFRYAFGIIISKAPIGQKESIGMVGAFTPDNLPNSILNEVSVGLTSVSLDGKAVPAAARSWRILDNGKTYEFTLRNDVFFNDGTKFNSSLVNYNFSDVKVTRPDKNTIVFKLKDSYSPFLLSVSRPILKNDFVGLGEFKITGMKINGDFVQSLTLVSVKDRLKTKYYQIYPSSESLKLAFLSGEISKAEGLSNDIYKGVLLASFPNTVLKKNVNLEILSTLFFNTKDPILSDKKIRSGLSYALPDEFSQGKRNYTLFSPNSWAYTSAFDKMSDYKHAEVLISQAGSASKSAEIKLKMKVLPKYKNVAEIVTKSWEKVGVKTKIETVESIPSDYQIFLGDFHPPQDPDQYTLWHSNQDNNITNYKSLRIDKLLEDGRRTTDIDERKKIYLDLQKYLLDDSPAVFLFFPYEYEAVRK